MKETTRTLIRLQPLFRELFADTVRLHLAPNIKRNGKSAIWTKNLLPNM